MLSQRVPQVVANDVRELRSVVPQNGESWEEVYEDGNGTYDDQYELLHRVKDIYDDQTLPPQIADDIDVPTMYQTPAAVSASSAQVAQRNVRRMATTGIFRIEDIIKYIFDVITGIITLRAFRTVKRRRALRDRDFIEPQPSRVPRDPGNNILIGSRILRNDLMEGYDPMDDTVLLGRERTDYKATRNRNPCAKTFGRDPASDYSFANLANTEPLITSDGYCMLGRTPGTLAKEEFETPMPMNDFEL